MRVAVIGAGASGLPAIKCCLDEGLDVVCFERRDDIGGLWNYTEVVPEGQSNVTRSTITLTTKEVMCYSDFPMPAHFPNYMHNSRLLEYFRLYADHFRLLQYIRFGMDVVSVSPVADFAGSGRGRWEVMVKEAKSGKTEKEIFDAVLVCTGHNSDKNMPHFDGEKDFRGQLIHSLQYRHADGYRNKTVVVVGAGNTACEAAVDLSHVCKQVHLSVGKGAWLVRRVWDNGLPLDLTLFTRSAGVFLRLAPASLINNWFQKQINSRFDHSLYDLQPDFNIAQHPPVTNDDLPCRILTGAVQVRPSIKRLTPSGVQFTDGTTIENVDAIVCATGYLFSYPFIKHKAFEELSATNVKLYKFMFPPDIQPPTLALIGCVEPLGPHPPVNEIQSRLAAKVFKGEIRLPDVKTMCQEIDKMQAAIEARFLPSVRRSITIDYVPYMDEISAVIGCGPPSFLRLILTDPRLALAVYVGVVTPYQFRLVGPGAWSGARDAVLGARERILFPLKTRSTTSTAGRGCGCLLLGVGAVAAAGVITALACRHYGWSVDDVVDFVKSKSFFS